MQISNGVKKMIAIDLAVIFFIGLDRFLKVFSFENQNSEFSLLGEILKFSYKNNYNVAFSLPAHGVWLNVVISLIILLLIIYLAKAWLESQQALTVSLLAIILGAGSNLYDRFKFDFVIDYFNLKYFTVFNLADAMITVGVAMLIVILYKKTS